MTNLSIWMTLGCSLGGLWDSRIPILVTYPQYSGGEERLAHLTLLHERLTPPST